MSRATCLCAGAVIALAGTSSVASAQERLNTLLTFDITDPAHVIVQATGESPDYEHMGTTMRQGVIMVEFFEEPYPFGSVGPPVLVSTLHPWSSVQHYLDIDNNYADISPMCMTFFTELPTLPDDQNFLITTPAFVGEMRLDFTGAALPQVGARGPITVGPFSLDDAPIGEWLVIPSPGAFALLGIGTCAIVRRRR